MEVYFTATELIHLKNYFIFRLKKKYEKMWSMNKFEVPINYPILLFRFKKYFQLIILIV